MTIHLYDGMAVLRQRLENAANGPRSVFSEAHQNTPGDVHIWCWEGRNHLASRRAIFPGYKVRPSTMTDGLFKMVDLIKDVLKHTSHLQVGVPAYEADDVIAHLCQVHGNGDNVIVHTIDRDLHALATPNVKVLANPLKECKAEQVQLYKVLVGDPSDRIPGMPGFGQKAWEACQPALLAHAMQMLLQGRAIPELFVKAGMKPAIADRLCAREQADLLRAYWSVIGFFQLPDDWDKYVTVGVPDIEAGDRLLRQFMH